MRRRWTRSSAYLRSPAAVVGLVLLLLVIAMALSADWFFPARSAGLAGRPLQWPFANPRFLLGTDNSGRDIAAQIFHGARDLAAHRAGRHRVAITIGIVVGALAGYLRRLGRRRADAHHRGVPDPAELPAAARAGRRVRLDIKTVTIAIGVVSWPAPARLTRAEFLSLRNREFVQACRTLGMRDIQIIFREILPNALPPVIVYASVVMAVAILLESALAFLGLSDPNVASWGNLIGAGRACCARSGTSRRSPASRSCSPCSRYRWSARA